MRMMLSLTVMLDNRKALLKDMNDSKLIGKETKSRGKISYQHKLKSEESSKGTELQKEGEQNSTERLKS